MSINEVVITYNAYTSILFFEKISMNSTVMYDSKWTCCENLISETFDTGNTNVFTKAIN